MTEKTSRAAGQKKEIVKVLTNLLATAPIIGVVNMEGLPAAQLQKITAQLRGKMELFMTKKRLMNIAMENAKKKNAKIEGIKKYFAGMPALLFTKENPFSIYRIIKKNKSAAPAKAGQVAPKDIVIKAGPTPFAPGPIISDLSAVGLKAGVEGGKVAIKRDSVVCKEGDKISAALASILTRLGIEPMEVGLNIVAIYENGTIYERRVLDIDDEKIAADIATAALSAVNIAMEIGYATKETVEIMIIKAVRESNSLKEAAGIKPEEKPVEKEAPKAEEKKEEKPAEVKAEEKKVEAKQKSSRKVSAAELVKEAETSKDVVEQKDKMKKSKDKKEVEELYQKLKKKGTLREGN